VAVKPIDAVDDKEISHILERLVILNLCKEAQEAGINLKTIPDDISKCSKILREIIVKEAPDMECTVKNYSVDRIEPYRLVVGRSKISMCPWSVQLHAIRKQEARISSISLAIRNVIPTVLSEGNSICRVVRGPIGEYTRSLGFDISYKSAANEDIILFAMPQKPFRSQNNKEALISEHVRIMRENRISPIAFAKAICLLYKELQKSYVIGVEIQKQVQEDQTAMKAMFEKNREEVKEKNINDLKQEHIVVNANDQAPIVLHTEVEKKDISITKVKPKVMVDEHDIKIQLETSKAKKRQAIKEKMEQLMAGEPE
jgi:hypothetical protein